VPSRHHNWSLNRDSNSSRGTAGDDRGELLSMVVDSQLATTRCRLTDDQWEDVERAARIARANGVKLTVHGIVIAAVSPRQYRQPQPVDAADNRRGRRVQAETAKATRPAASVGTKRSLKRKQRSMERLVEFQARKRKALIASSTRIQYFVKTFRWVRMQNAWTEWMAAQQPPQPPPDPPPKPCSPPDPPPAVPPSGGTATTHTESSDRLLNAVAIWISYARRLARSHPSLRAELVAELAAINAQFPNLPALSIE
jgi:hypothetical protein